MKTPEKITEEQKARKMKYKQLSKIEMKVKLWYTVKKIKFITIDELRELVNKGEKEYKFPQKMEKVLEKLRGKKSDNNI